VLATLAGCASLAIQPCDTIADRDGKYFGRFFLGVATLGLSEVTIQQEEIRQAYQGSPGCPPPPGVTIASASIPNPAGGQAVAIGTLVNGTPWTIVIYLNQDPDVQGAAPLTFLSPAASMQLAFRSGQHRLVAPDRRGPRHPAPSDVAPADRDRPPSPWVQASIQRGGLHVTRGWAVPFACSAGSAVTSTARPAPSEVHVSAARRST
jgi:hypothetical protein